MHFSSMLIIFRNMFLFVFFLFLQFNFESTVAQSTNNPPPFKDYAYSNITNAYYRCYGTPVNFTTAITKCENDGAELGVPRNRIEYEVLIANFGSNIYSVWLAFTDREEEGKFKTLSGLPESQVFTNWEPSEPNNGGTGEDCVEMLFDGRYNDVRCEDIHAYICVKPLIKAADENAPLVQPAVTSSPVLGTKAKAPPKVTKIDDGDQDSIVTPPPQPQRFRKDYTYDSQTGYYYKAFAFARNFSTALQTCKTEGAQLAVPKIKKDADVLITKFRPGTEACWVGIFDILVESQFQTVDGTPISQTYLNWKPSFPNYFRDDRDCVIIDNKGFYYDTGCEGNYQFICTRHESTITNNNLICDTYDDGYFYNIEGDRCYKLHKVAADWQNALAICRAEQASLAVINSQSEATILNEILTNSSRRSGNFNKTFIHVDFNDLVTPQNFMTSDLTPLADTGYENWDDDEPDNRDGNEHCGGMLRNGKLADVNCKTRALFFCEKVLSEPLAFELLQRGKHPRDK